MTILRQRLTILEDQYQLLRDHNDTIWVTNIGLSRRNRALEEECSRLRRNLIQGWSYYLRGPSRIFLNQFQLYEYEINYLHQSVSLFRSELDRHQLPHPELPLPPRWTSTLLSSRRPPTWIENSPWDQTNPLNHLSNPSFSFSSSSYGFPHDFSDDNTQQ